MANEITMKEVQNKIKNGVTTFLRKNNSPRGCETVSASEIKIGDEIVIDNYFTTVVDDSKEIMNIPEVVAVDAEKKKEYKAVCKQLANCVKSLEVNYIKLAVGLAHINREKLYEIDGYKNIYDFAKENYAISKSTCYNFLGLVEVFGLTSDCKPVFTSQQMVAMLPYIRQGGSVEEFMPDMSVREMKRQIKEKLSRRLENKEDGEQLEVNENGEVIELSKSVRNVLISCKSQEDYNKKIDDIDALILNMFNMSKKRVRIEIVAVEY